VKTVRREVKREDTTNRMSAGRCLPHDMDWIGLHLDIALNRIPGGSILLAFISLYSFRSLSLYSTLLYSTLLYSSLLYSSLLYSTLLYSTLLFSTLVFFLLYPSISCTDPPAVTAMHMFRMFCTGHAAPPGGDRNDTREITSEMMKGIAALF
jgi:hypothetical protein